MFRAERPAKGRYRQFHQGGCEIYGDPGPLCDAELIDLCAEFIQALGIDAFQIHVNSLGSSGVRERYRQALVRYFEPVAATLSEDSQRRLKTNPLRILDSKAPQDREVIAGAPSVVDLLEGEDATHFEQLLRYLDALEVPYVVDPKLVRGLDYYTRTLFELKETSGTLGSQDALLGGGRYDGMVTRLGGKKPVPAIGFAMGIERILELVEDDEPRRAPDCYLAPMTEPARERAVVLAKQLRRLGRYCEVDGRGLSVKAMLRRANTLGSTLALLLGESELSRGVVTVKNLAAHEQDEVPLDQAAEVLAGRLAARGETDGRS